MKHVMFRFAYWSIITFLVFSFISACDLLKPEDEPEDKGSVAGYVYSPSKSPLQGVSVTIGTQSTLTDASGYFSLSDVPVGSNVLVNFKKASYIGTQRIVTVSKDNTTNASCTIFQASYSDFSSAAANTLSSNGAQISLPANAFISNGIAFTGTVRAEYYYFDPSNSIYLDAFPGNFSGVQTDGTEVMFETYGFINASFFDAANPNTKLSLASGVSALITVPIPLQLQANAPQSMPMWYYNESTGKWMEEGAGTKVGNTYQGSVSHFSWWNYDLQIPVSMRATLTGTVVMNDANHTPVPYAHVVGIGFNYYSGTNTRTDANGNFSLYVRANSQVRVQAYEGFNSSTPTSTITTPAPGGTANIGLILMNETSTIRGTLVDENYQPVVADLWGQLFEYNPSSENFFDADLMTDNTGYFVIPASGQIPGTELTVIVKLNIENEVPRYSAPFTFIMPEAIGHSLNLGTIIMHPPAIISGVALDGSGNWIQATSALFFSRYGDYQESVTVLGPVASEGVFELVGPSNVTLTNMTGEVSGVNEIYHTMPMDISFPASGQTNNIGNVYFIP